MEGNGISQKGDLHSFSCVRFAQSTCFVVLFLLETFTKHNYGNGIINITNGLARMCHCCTIAGCKLRHGIKPQ